MRKVLKAESMLSTASVDGKEKHFSSKENIWDIFLNNLEQENF